jgi:hypothetical protein
MKNALSGCARDYRRHRSGPTDPHVKAKANELMARVLWLHVLVGVVLAVTAGVTAGAPATNPAPVPNRTRPNVEPLKVVHWKVGHYAAMVRKVGDFYELRDPTFGNSTWATPIT